jgi:hypothetical protein
MGKSTGSTGPFSIANCKKLPGGNPNQPFLTIINPFQPLDPSLINRYDPRKFRKYHLVI